MTTATGPALGAALDAPMMGGRVSIRLTDGDPRRAALAMSRMRRWADRLTRFDARSELSRLNADPRRLVPIGPTLTAVLDWARGAEALSDGIVNAAFLDARERAESGGRGLRVASRRWSLRRTSRGALVEREPGLRFDLDGLAKGWLADRALDGLGGPGSAVVDADGDVALEVAPGDAWPVEVADPRASDGVLVRLALPASGDGSRRWGVATSGTSVHRWFHPGGMAHHLIDPRTGRPAETDVVQATALASTAREAEAYAKTAVILGSDAAIGALDRPGVLGLVLLTTRGELLASPITTRWLA